MDLSTLVLWLSQVTLAGGFILLCTAVNRQRQQLEGLIALYEDIVEQYAKQTLT